MHDARGISTSAAGAELVFVRQPSNEVATQFQLAQLIFDVNMLAIGVLWYINWHYASNNGLVDEKVMPYAEHIRRSNLALPVLAIIAILASFVTPRAIFVFLAAPVIFILYTVSKRIVPAEKSA